MSSIFQQALGVDFSRLHPKMQKRFGFSSTDRVALVGTGVMDEVWHGRFYTVPFLYFGTWRNILFPDRMRKARFTIENYPYVDEFGREMLTIVRTFYGPRRRRFDAYMTYNEERGCIVDYLGTHQHLAVDLHPSVDEQGRLHIRSGQPRFYEGSLAFTVPQNVSGMAELCEWYDPEKDLFHIRVGIQNPRWGPIFGYYGTFQTEWRSVTGEEIPRRVKPRRAELRA